jgi:hypothetical protein
MQSQAVRVPVRQMAVVMLRFKLLALLPVAAAVRVTRVMAETATTVK